MQKPPILYIHAQSRLQAPFPNHIPISASARRRYNILIERKRDKHNNNQQINHRAHRPHGFRNLLLIALRHIFTLKSCFHERRAQPTNHAVGSGESEAAEGERGDEGFAIFAREGFEEEGDTEDGEGEVEERFGEGERGARARGRCVFHDGWEGEMGCISDWMIWRGVVGGGKGIG